MKQPYRIEIGMGGEHHELHFSGPLTARSVAALETNVRLFREMFEEQQALNEAKAQFLSEMSAEYGPPTPTTGDHDVR